jgi:periplasmic protein TonB
MQPRSDILDQPEPLRGPFWGSVILHISVAAAAFLTVWTQGHHKVDQWGYVTGGGLGSVAVNPVARIPLPTQSGAPNPVANDTASRVPEPKAVSKPQTKVKAPDPAAIALNSRNANKRPAPAAAAPNKYRAQQVDAPNQLYSAAGQKLSSNMIGKAGSGDVRPGDSTPFGTQFGYYKDLITNRVAQYWRTSDIDPRIRTAQPVMVTFTIRRDGSVPPGSVRVRQSSGMGMLDISAQRAIQDASPFPPLPQQFSRNEADIEFWFELRR